MTNNPIKNGVNTFKNHLKGHNNQKENRCLRCGGKEIIITGNEEYFHYKCLSCDRIHKGSKEHFKCNM